MELKYWFEMKFKSRTEYFYCEEGRLFCLARDSNKPYGRVEPKIAKLLELFRIAGIETKRITIFH